LEVGRTIDQGGGGDIRWAHGYEKNGGIRPPVIFLLRRGGEISCLFWIGPECIVQYR